MLFADLISTVIENSESNKTALQKKLVIEKSRKSYTIKNIIHSKNKIIIRIEEKI